MVQEDKTLKTYFPEELIKGRKFDREYVFNILNTVYPGYLEDIVKYANSQRTSSTDEKEKENTILVTAEWEAELTASPFYSKVST